MTLKKFKIDEAKVCVCVCLHACMCACVRVHAPVCMRVRASMCVSLASYSSELLKPSIIIKLGMVTASDMVMNHMLIILILTIIQGHTDLNHE